MVRETLSVSTRDRTANDAACKKGSSEALTDSTTSYRVAGELVPEPAGTAGELAQLPPPGSVGGGGRRG